jgi:GDSL-like Lipase/Acylhydrolase family
MCHKTPNFIEKAARAGVTRVFIGLENINPANLLGVKKRQNKITEYRKMLLAWKHAGVVTYAGYILGFPSDTPQSILEDIEIIKRELPLDILEFFCLTPLPGSEDHRVLWEKGAWMDPDMNKYDLEHVTAHHARMTDEEWELVYRAAWAAYYTPAHKLTILRRAAAAGMGLSRLRDVLFFFSSMGTNDIRRGASADQVIGGTKNIISRLKGRGIKTIGATIVPRHGAVPGVENTGWNDAKTKIRNEVNDWIRKGADFDAVIDFDKVVRSANDPNLLAPAYNCGDGVHPSPIGYFQMGRSINLGLFDAK